MSEEMRRQIAFTDYMRPLFKLAVLRNFFKRKLKVVGSTADERARTHTSVWSEVEDAQGRKAVSRLHGPEGGVIWTARAALAAVQKVLAGNVSPGFQTLALAYGADFVLECEGVTREDIN